MKLRFFIPLLIAIALGPSCAPQKVIVETAPDKEAVEAVTPGAHFARADKLLDDKAYAAAAASYMALVSAFPGHARVPEALMKAGAAYFLAGDYVAARNAYRQVVAGYPDFAHVAAARIGIVQTYFHTGEFEELVVQAGEVLETDMPGESKQKLYAILGDTYMALDAPVDAARAYALAYELALGQPAGDDLYERLKSALRLMERSQISMLTDRLERQELKSLVDELAHALIYKRFSIGCLLPLSGRYEVYGQRALNGVQLALSKSSAARSNPHLEIIIRDTRSDPDVAAREVQALYESGVAAIIGPIVTAEPAARAAQEKRLSIITFTQKDSITGIGDFVFRNFFTPAMQVRAIVSHAVADIGARRFAILYPEEKYGRTFMGLFWDEVIRQNGKVVAVESYDVKTTDFADPIRKLVGRYYKIPADIQARAEHIWPPFNKAPKDTCDGFERIPGLMAALPKDLSCWKERVDEKVPDCVPQADSEAGEPPESPSIVDFDAIFIPDAPNKAGLILPQLAFFDVNEVTLMGTNLWNSKTLIEMSREYAQGAVVPDGFYAGSARPAARRFVEDYQAAFADPPGYMEAIGFDTASLVLDLVNRPDVRARTELRDELLRVADFRGATGVTAFDYNGDVHKSLFLVRLKGGRFVEIEKTAPTLEKQPEIPPAVLPEE